MKYYIKALLLISLLHTSCKENKQIQESYYPGRTLDYSVKLTKNSSRIYLYQEEDHPGLSVLIHEEGKDYKNETIKLDTTQIGNFQKMVQRQIENYDVSSQPKLSEWIITFSASHGMDELSVNYNSTSDFNDVSPEFYTFMKNAISKNSNLKNTFANEG